MFSTYAAEGFQGEHRFFTTSLRWGELASSLVFHDELTDLDEDQRMQRGLARTRLQALSHYLTEEDDHFFSALTLMMLPRDLDQPAHEAEDEDDDDEWDFMFVKEKEKRLPGQQRFGVLHLSGNIRLFPADGQHRAKAGMQALKEAPDLAKEAVPVVLIPYKTPDQVRQMFSDLNLNAKPISRTLGYDFETRVPIAIAAKTVGHSVPLFQGRVNRSTNSLPKSSGNVITLNTLVDSTRDIVRGLLISNGTPPETTDKDMEALVSTYVDGGDGSMESVINVWQDIVDAFGDHWAPVIAGEDGAAGELRDAYLFPHGLGWRGLSKAAGRLIAAHGDGWAAKFNRGVHQFDWRREAPEWTGEAVIYNPETKVYRVNNTAPAIDSLAEKVVNAAER